MSKEVKINVPEGASESEKSFIVNLSAAITKAFNERDADLEGVVKSVCEKHGVSKEEMEKITEAVKAQGEALKALKERPAGRMVNGMKKAFYDNFDKFVDALKNRRAGFEIKAVSEHTAGDIQTTANSIELEGNATAEEVIGENPNMFMKRRGRQYIHDIANVSVVDKVPEVFNFYEEGDEKGAIATVTENGLKPQVHLKVVKNQVEAQKAAGYIVVTEEMLKWRSRLWAQIQRLFSDKITRDYEDLLTTKLIAEAASYANTAWDDSIENPTDLDAIIATVAQLEALNFSPDVLVINPNDKWKLAMSETKNGTLILPYIQQGGQFGLLGLRVITTTKVDAGTFIVGESGTWFVEEERPVLRTGLVNDDLIYNRYTIVGELWFLSYVPSNNDGSFVKSTFATVKEALKKPDSGVGG